MSRDRGNEDGFPVVMLHGWPESSYCWEGVAAFLDPKLRVIAPDLRGLGDSERTLDVKAYQKVELAKDMVEIVNALGINEFFLAGHDWGGIVAQEMAFLIPDRVKKFVILNIPVLTNVKGAQEVTKAMIAMRYIPYWYQYFQMMPGLAEAMIKGKEREWVSFFFGKKAGTAPFPGKPSTNMSAATASKIRRQPGHPITAPWPSTLPAGLAWPAKDFPCRRCIFTAMKTPSLFRQTSPIWKIALIRSRSSKSKRPISFRRKNPGKWPS